MKLMIWVFPFFVGVWSAQAQTAIEKFKNICETKASSYVASICSNTGQISRFALNMPRICKERGWGNSISEALKECGSGNVYSDIWKFVYNGDQALQSSIATFIDKGANQGGVKGFEGIDRFGLFEIFYLACEKDSECHRRLFNVIPKNIRNELIKTPLFCDYESVNVSYFASTDDSVLLDKSDPTGFSHPTCQAYYCIHHDCNEGVELIDDNELFIISKIWDQYYKVNYRGNLDD